ncbi:5-formyltetrahydrofolate cyclo-ligase [Methanobacterium petrolearium]|uniref:5-formyltetrahydrofolate cyclo-ligase n=1 Tax=Methanobacterium petrolearium TaxID=710190 RepID=UPI001AE27E7A|nr:5-formyltetrahydrofolate cyclo-ligase [Methanobacterium petrolearium]MBP1945185.1 5-formyltetrahydrofolate cyclo-ligase [Methanobacterium petrolearium]BDZ71114.1 hypothetical protein GCM10025861_16310 [Methanobacterium petrolearium]
MTYRDKQKLRKKIWGVLERNELIRTSESCYGRIPNFKGASLAAFILKNTFEWENSQTIFSSPDSALREVREHALEDKKILIMATPKIMNGYILINPKKVSGREKIASTINGALKMGEKIKNFPQIDLVVEGSLAVDLKGNRLGKGKGFADQEISHLYSKKAIDEDIPICTPVHQLQIVDQVPVESHDEKISMIVTPEMVVRTDSITEI